MILLLACLLPAQPDFTLLLFCDPKAAASQPLFPAILQAYQKGYHVGYVDIAGKHARLWLTFWQIPGDPVYVLHDGRAPLEYCHGPLDAQQITAWFCLHKRPLCQGPGCALPMPSILRRPSPN